VLLQASKNAEDMATISGRKEHVLRAAPTEIAAHNFHDRTLHSLFRILAKVPHRVLLKNSQEQACVQYLITDEQSMVGIKFLGLLDQCPRKIFTAYQNEMYTSINIFICGEFYCSRCDIFKSLQRAKR
jgi:ATP-dependent DNA helicase PIF1